MFIFKQNSEVKNHCGLEFFVLSVRLKSRYSVLILTVSYFTEILATAILFSVYLNFHTNCFFSYKYLELI